MNKIPRYAPVVIPTLCRFEHFKRCVESLSKCTGADKTELYIGLDYPSKDSHLDGYNKICSYIPKISGFKNVIVIKRDKNYGAIRNSKELILHVKPNYETYIFSEDDNEFSPNFLEYINKGLIKYKNDPNIIAICGYAEPRVDYKQFSKFPYNAYPMVGYNAWGVGVWFHKKPVEQDPDEILGSIRRVAQVVKNGHGIAIHRLFMRKRTNAVGDLMWRIYCATNKKYCIFPKISKVRNWGFDESASNCSSLLSNYKDMEIDSDNSFEYDNFKIMDYPSVIKLQKSLYGLSFHNLLLFLFEYSLYRVSGGLCLRDIYFFTFLMRLKLKIKLLLRKGQ